MDVFSLDPVINFFSCDIRLIGQLREKKKKVLGFFSIGMVKLPYPSVTSNNLFSFDYKSSCIVCALGNISLIISVDNILFVYIYSVFDYFIFSLCRGLQLVTKNLNLHVCICRTALP